MAEDDSPKAGANHYMTIAEAAALRPAAVPLDADSGIDRLGGTRVPNHTGRLRGWEEFERTEIWRKNPTLPLTAYFDPVAYKLATGTSKLHVMKARGAA